ncbi:MAG: MmcB family DNA repair protein [Salinarimonas sp.]|nr:MmcB family DNA repair protein [Salinarimonas sp.]
MRQPDLQEHIPTDGRQSPAALAVQRGVRRLFARMQAASVTELVLASGRRADIVVLGRGGEIAIIEIKSSVADFRADRKWQSYRAFCDRFYFAVPEAFPVALIPEDAGLILADGFDAAILREPPEHPLAGARRKAVTLRFAHAAAGTLLAISDPAARLPDAF